MALLQLKQLTVSYGGPNLLDKVDFQIDKGERICLVGRNGAGKSTLMKVIAGDVLPDSGEMAGLSSLKIARLEQEVPAGTRGSVFDVVAAGLGDIAPLLVNYHHIVQQLQHDSSEAILAKLEKAQHQLEAADGWSLRLGALFVSSTPARGARDRFWVRGGFLAGGWGWGGGL